MIKSRAIIEIIGFPEEHVNKILNQVTENLKKEQGIKIIKDHKEPAELIKEMWSSFIELELGFDDFIRLNQFCFSYLPSSIEIIDQETINLTANDFNKAMNDLLNRLHEYNLALNNLNAQLKLIKTEKKATSS